MYTAPLARRLSATLLASVLTALPAACATSTPSSTPGAAPAGMPGMSMPVTGNSAGASPTGMPGMAMNPADPMYDGTGLSASDNSFTLSPMVTTTLAAGKPETLRFKILDSTGMTVTAFELDQTTMMHLYLVRLDLTGFQHVHPVMAPDGTWSANLSALAPGSYRAYTAFNAKNAARAVIAEVLSRTLSIPGSARTEPLPTPTTATTVDGYTLTVTGQMIAGMTRTLKVSVTSGGRPVTNLQPYLETYAHLTAIHAGDLAFAHLHPQGPAAATGTGGPELSFQTALPAAGDWRLFLQFQTGGVLHTAAITLHVS